MNHEVCEGNHFGGKKTGMKTTYSRADRQIYLYCIHRVLSACLFSRGIFMLYLAHKGLNIAQIGIYQMLVQVSMFLLEIPTGYIGDKVGKVKSMQTGTALLFLYCVLMVWLRQPLALMLLGILEGMGYTFVSGSDSALLYDLLKAAGREGEYLPWNAKLQAAESILTGVTISLGAVMLSVSWDAVYQVTAVCLAASWAVLLFLKEPGKARETRDRPAGAWSRLKSTILYPDLVFFAVCIVGFSCFDGLSGSYYNYNQILFEQKEIPVSLIGFFFSAAYLASSGAYLLADLLSRNTAPKTIILRMAAVQGILFAALGAVSSPFVFAALSFACCLIPEVIYILADSIIQEWITSEYRATMLSLVSMLRSLASAVTYSALGAVLNQMEIRGFMFFLAAVTLGSLLGFRVLLWLKHRKACR